MPKKPSIFPLCNLQNTLENLDCHGRGETVGQGRKGQHTNSHPTVSPVLILYFLSYPSDRARTIPLGYNPTWLSVFPGN